MLYIGPMIIIEVFSLFPVFGAKYKRSIRNIKQGSNPRAGLHVAKINKIQKVRLCVAVNLFSLRTLIISFVCLKPSKT